MKTATEPVLSLVTPAWNEQDNLPVLYSRICNVLDPIGIDWEWVVVDDHSGDNTFGVLTALARQDPRVRAIRFARNSGSHRAMPCGLVHARGACAIVLAADLQDPPETIPELMQKWQEGAQVVWAVRAAREGETASTIGFSRLYYWIMRNVAGMKEMPSTGADFFLIDRLVLEAFKEFHESNTSVLALITWMGYRQTSLVYDKKARLHGSSGWSLEKKLKLVIDSVTAFTYLPIRLMSYAGFVVAFVGFIYAGTVVWNAFRGNPPEGWASLMVALVVLNGIQMIMMGVLGEYVWRSLDESRRRPRFLIEATTDTLPALTRERTS